MIGNAAALSLILLQGRKKQLTPNSQPLQLLSCQCPQFFLDFQLWSQPFDGAQRSLPAIQEDGVQRIGYAALGAPLKILAVVLCRIPSLNGSEALFFCIQLVAT